MDGPASDAAPASAIQTRVSQETTAGGFPFVYEKDVAVTMGDGVALRVNVFRPAAAGRYPVLLSHGVYGKDTHFSLAFAAQWERLLEIHPGLIDGESSGRFLRWEVPDPERFLPDGYALVVADARGTGKSAGFLDPFSPREVQDHYELIEWAGVQGWSNGKVGLSGISYLATNQWLVAALQPPHLDAICPWEGWWDHYRDFTRHGGILANSFPTAWWPRQVLVNQHGNADTRYRDAETGEPPTGPALGVDMLAGNRAEYPAELRRHPLADAWHRARTAEMGRVTVPLLSAANWGGPGVHMRGNFAGFAEAASQKKWLSAHIGTHFESFYLPEYVALQKRFYDRFLKDADNGWEDEPPVRLAIRRADGTAAIRAEREWPLARTRWTKFHLDASGSGRSGIMACEAPESAGRVDYDPGSDLVTFVTSPFASETEVTGPVAARLTIASTTADMDVFATLHLLDPAGEETVFTGAHEPTPLARGWLRASQRRLDPERSTPWRPYLAHDRAEPLEPGRACTVDMEIWPTSIVVPAGWRLALRLQGHDFEYEGIPGRILHDDPDDRDPAVFGGTDTILTGGEAESWLLLPVIPGQR